jgi:pimeloyl-ACP methyl ester carboxylesterase
VAGAESAENEKEAGIADLLKDVVVLLPGILGSVLERDGKVVWGFTAGGIGRAVMSLGDSIKDLKLGKDSPVAPYLDDGIRATRVMPDIHLIPGLWKIDGYGAIGDAIKNSRWFKVQPGENYFEFPYDWRRDIRSAAHRLAEESERWLHGWRQKSPEAKLALVAHSQGGLVSRYFLENLEGWRDTRILVTFGTPYGGSLNPLNFISNGFKKGFGPFKVNLTPFAQSLTALYQMMAIDNCYSPTEGSWIQIADATDIPGVDPARAKAGLEFHEEIADAVERHKGDPEYQQNLYRIVPVVGVFQPTLQSAKLNNGKLVVMNEFEGVDRAGDSTVPRRAAVPAEIRGRGQEHYMSEKHSKLQDWPPSITEILGILSDEGMTIPVQAVPGSRLSLDIEDAFLHEESIAFGVRTDGGLIEVRAEITDTDTDEPVAGSPAELAAVGDEWKQLEIPALPEGSYRIEVSASGIVNPVSDVFVVYPPDA